jgi:hypothetical protein
VAERSRRRWSLEAAREVFGDVRRRTSAAVDAVDALLVEREACEPDSEVFAAVEARIRREAGRWARAMEALGLEVKGLWLVDFDNGSGYYCWRWPEPDLGWFHGYDEGFAGRVRIQ